MERKRITRKYQFLIEMSEEEVSMLQATLTSTDLVATITNKKFPDYHKDKLCKLYDELRNILGQ